MSQQKTAILEVNKDVPGLIENRHSARQAKKADVTDFFGVKLSPPEWLIKETTFGLDPQHIQESIFALGNGFMGSRGILEECPERAMPGTYIAGVFDRSGAQCEEMVNLPNPINFNIIADGEKLDMRFRLMILNS